MVCDPSKLSHFLQRKLLEKKMTKSCLLHISNTKWLNKTVKKIMPFPMQCPRATSIFFNASSLMFLSHFSRILQNLFSKEFSECFHITINYFYIIIQ